MILTYLLTLVVHLSVCDVEVLSGCVHLCRVAGNTVYHIVSLYLKASDAAP